MVFHILVASYTDEVYTLQFDPQASSLRLVSAVNVGQNPSWITPHPDDRSLIFAALEQDPQGKIVVLKYSVDGQGQVVAEVSSGGSSPCAMHATTDELFIANFMAGSLATYPISAAPPYISAADPILVHMSGTGPNLARQQSSHPHQVVMHPDRQELFVPDLGADKTWRFARDNNTGSWIPIGAIHYPAGSGPRHVVLHDEMLYTVLELISVVASHRFPPHPEEPVTVCTSSTYVHPPEDLQDRLAAEILITKPSTFSPTTYLYVSNRNDPSPEGDSITIFSIKDPDALQLVGEFRTGLNHVRGIAFGGEDDRWLIAGGVNGGGVKVFERIDGGRNFRLAAQNEDIKAPTGFIWL